MRLFEKMLWYIACRVHGVNPAEKFYSVKNSKRFKKWLWIDSVHNFIAGKVLLKEGRKMLKTIFEEH